MPTSAPSTYTSVYSPDTPTAATWCQPVKRLGFEFTKYELVLKCTALDDGGVPLYTQAPSSLEPAGVRIWWSKVAPLNKERYAPGTTGTIPRIHVDAVQLPGVGSPDRPMRRVAKLSGKDTQSPIRHPALVRVAEPESKPSYVYAPAPTFSASVADKYVPGSKE